MSICKWTERVFFQGERVCKWPWGAGLWVWWDLEHRPWGVWACPHHTPLLLTSRPNLGMFKSRIWVQSHCTDMVESWRFGGAAVGAHGLNSLVLGSLMEGFCAGILCLVPRQMMLWVLLTLTDKPDRFSCSKVKTEWVTKNCPSATQLPPSSAPCSVGAGLGPTPAQQRQPWLPTFAKLYLLCTGLSLRKAHEAKAFFMLCVADCEWSARRSGIICVQLR